MQTPGANPAYIEAATLVTRYMNLPPDAFLEPGFAPHMRTGVVSRMGHVLMATVCKDNGILTVLFPPSVTRGVRPGKLVIDRDFSLIDGSGQNTYLVESSGSVKGNLAIHEVLGGVCDAVERIYPRKILVPEVFSGVRSQVRAALGERAAPRTLFTHMSPSQLERGGAHIYAQFFAQYQNHEVIIARIRAIRDGFNRDFDGAAQDLPADTDPGALYTLVNYVCDNAEHVQGLAQQ